MARHARNKVLDYAVYIALRLVAMSLQCWPVEWCLAGASVLGDFMFYVDKKHRDRALENLRFSFPEFTEKRRRRIARRSMRQFFQLGVELIFTTRLVKLETWTKVSTLHNFEPVVRLLLERHRGAVMITGHYGNWEIAGYLLATLGFETTSVARPLDNPYVHEWLLGVRERRGQKIVAKTGAMEVVPTVLEAGGTVGLIADQNAGSKGMFVDFFNRKASTYKSIGILAMRYNAPVIIGYARRREGKFHFDVGIQDIIYPQDWESRPKEELAAAAKLAATSAV
jgi:KDO2-lipid IV(A) lauroyltransferase